MKRIRTLNSGNAGPFDVLLVTQLTDGVKEIDLQSYVEGKQTGILVI